MIGEELAQKIIEMLLERMREIESVKAPNMIHGFDLMKIGAIGERAEHGVPVTEIYGTSTKFPYLEQLRFVPAMIAKKPFDPLEVNTQTRIGPRAKKPLRLPTPIMVTAMAYGLSISKNAKLAWGKGSALAGTACNSGDAGFYAPEREQAKYYIVQYNRAGYGNSEEELKQADAIEIRFGQATMGALGETIESTDIDEELAKHLNLEKDQSAIRPILYKEMKEGKKLKDIVEKIKNINGDVPIGVKIAAGNIERDLDEIIEAECDFVTIDGAGGGTAGSPKVTIDNSTLPLIFAIPRAYNYLVKKGVKENISIIAVGGLRDSGDYTKILALGADAVYAGQSALIAMVYSQLHKVPAGTSPAEIYLTWGKHNKKFDWEAGAKELANYLKASTTEMAMLTGLVGKKDIKEVSLEDLVCFNTDIKNAIGIPLAWEESK
jgi:glutamate synthase domain-containing protein 2